MLSTFPLLYKLKEKKKKKKSTSQLLIPTGWGGLHETFFAMEALFVMMKKHFDCEMLSKVSL